MLKLMVNGSKRWQPERAEKKNAVKAEKKKTNQPNTYKTTPPPKRLEQDK